MENDRRDFLKASANFMGVLTAFGLTGSTAYAETPTSPLRAPVAAPVAPAKTAIPVQSMPAPLGTAAATTFNNVMMDALATKNMAITLPKFQAQLTREQYNALQKLTPQDLAQLQAIRDKVGPSVSQTADTRW